MKFKLICSNQMLGDFEIEIYVLNVLESFYFLLLDFRLNGVKDL